MNFKAWMLSQGLSTSTAEKYAGAVTGPLTDWGLRSGVLQRPLVAMESAADYKAAHEKIVELPIFQERNQRGHGMYASALEKYASFLHEVLQQNVETDIAVVLNDPNISPTEKLELVNARIGQGKFRQKLILHWKGCAVTQYTELRMLVASHIKPWNTSSNGERLDPFNGLLLIPNLDRAFDRGLISFKPDGLILISPLLMESERLGISADMKVPLQDAHQSYMAHHRAKVFLSS